MASIAATISETLTQPSKTKISQPTASQPTASQPTYDAVLMVSFGGPGKPEDVMPFLLNVVAGRNVPQARLETVAKQYHSTGGASPINEQCQRLCEALTKKLEESGHDMAVYWGNRNWTPYLADTVKAMTQAGHKRALAIMTSAYSSYSGCRQYQENITEAQNTAGPQSPIIDVIRPYYYHPLFIESFADAAIQARKKLEASARDEAVMIATAHSIPTAMAEACDYEKQLRTTTRQVANLAGFDKWALVWQSRSGPPHVPWLEPDVNDYLEEKATELEAVVLVPIGFITDHTEVLWDLDNEAADTATKLHISMARAVTPGTTPEDKFITLWSNLIESYISAAEISATSATEDVPRVVPDFCPANCCPESLHSKSPFLHAKTDQHAQHSR